MYATNRGIEQLQYEYLKKLICINKTMTIKQALHRLEVLNESYARIILARN